MIRQPIISIRPADAARVAVFQHQTPPLLHGFQQQEVTVQSGYAEAKTVHRIQIPQGSHALVTTNLVFECEDNVFPFQIEARFYAVDSAQRLIPDTYCTVRTRREAHLTVDVQCPDSQPGLDIEPGTVLGHVYFLQSDCEDCFQVPLCVQPTQQALERFWDRSLPMAMSSATGLTQVICRSAQAATQRADEVRGSAAFQRGGGGLQRPANDDY